jgi:ankyrin repeat protein
LPVAQRASVTIVEVLLKAGSDPAARDYQGLSGLHGLVQIERASPNQPVAEVAKLLVGAGLPVDALDNYGDTPLWRAIMAYQPGSFGTIDVLLSMGADPSIPNKKGVTAHWLAMKLDGREELRQHLRVKWPNVFG